MDTGSHRRTEPASHCFMPKIPAVLPARVAGEHLKMPSIENCLEERLRNVQVKATFQMSLPRQTSSKLQKGVKPT